MQLPFPVGPRAEPNAALVTAAATQYELGTVTHARDIGGTYNFNLHAVSERGAYVVRVYRPWVTVERLVLLHRIKRTLVEHHLPVSLPLPGVGGASIMEYNGRLVDVEPFVQHDGVADTWERYATGFVMLGRFHQALEPFSMQLIQTPPLVSNYGTPAQLIGWTKHTRDQIESATPTAAAALAVCDQALALLDLLQEGWKDTPPLLHTGTHGDYGGENVLFRREQIVAILEGV